ncbi:lipoprotein-releasing ABC transporter permease subunit [Kordiimonas aestuarii]|uniref:lipoprotein-releasing ABC transporter permease subunit n=1 Tax=Kordiimonas aestuarii TaxID=1005925 RepID=UPI0021CF2B13|nr:lipoprotein-releasing ABC transporter permease subunit [Kordiimonas aestuarii]
MLARGYEWSVAMRYMLARKRDRVISVTAVLSVTAIALGVTALIVVMAVMNGFRAELMDKILGYHGHILIQGYGGKLSGYEQIMDDLKGTDGIVKMMPFSENQVMVTNEGEAWGAIVRGLPDNFFDAEKLGIAEVKAGSLSAAPEEAGLVLGHQLANRLRVTAGDRVTIVSPKSVPTPFGSTLRYLSYPVAAVVEIGVYQFDESFIGMPLGEAQRFFRLENTVANIELMLTEPDAVDTVGPEISAIVGERAYVRTWRSLNQSLVGALQTERVMMFLIVGLIILVAVFNISSSLFMLVKDKSPDIAILRTIGATQASIKRIFVTIGLVVGSAGIISGGLLSWLIIANIEGIKSFIERAFGLQVWDPSVRFISSLRAEVNLTEAGLTIGLALLLSFAATIIPARRAAKIDPVEVLRYE